MKKWYKLDNVGKFYASTTMSSIPRVFRFSALLVDDINESVLQEALNKTVEVYPNFNVNLKKGLFWYYLDETNKMNKVTKENLPVCFKIYSNSDDFLYRVSYYKRKINLEVSHIISDGRGSIEFFKLLVSNYINIKYDLGVDTTIDNKSNLEKTEDSFNKYYKKKNKHLNIVKRKSTYFYKGKKYRNKTRFMEFHMNVKDLLDVAHRMNTTLTGLLLSLYIYSFKDVLSVEELSKYIKIDLPVDLRSFFKSNSSMNFFGLTTVAYKFESKDDTLEDVIKHVNKHFKENLTKEKLSGRVNTMVSFERNWFCRFVPIFIKDVVMSGINAFTSQASTSSFSNIGIIKLDPKFEEKVESFGVLTSTDGFRITVCTIKDDICIGFASRFVNNDVIKNFMRYLTSNGIDIVADVSEV